MIFTDKVQVKFAGGLKYQKILHLSTAIHGTICFLGIKGHRQGCLTHMSADGKIIKQQIFQQNIDSFGMLSQKEVMVLETSKNSILIWNLENNSEINLQFIFKSPQSDQSQIFLFPQTRLVCIQQNGRYNDPKFKLTYYRYQIEQFKNPLVTYENDDVWTYQYLIRKANNHSMVCWFKGRHDDGFQFRTFDLRDGPQGKYCSYKFANDINKFIPNAPKAEVAITTMWQMTPSKFMIVCISTLSNHATQIQKVNNNFVYNASDNSLRQAKFSLGKYADLHLDQHNFGSTCMFRTFDFDSGKALQTPVYYINNETQQIIAQQKWKCSYLHKYGFPGFDGNLLLDCMYENGNVKQVTILAKKTVEYHISQLITIQLLRLVSQMDESLIEMVLDITDLKNN